MSEMKLVSFLSDSTPLYAILSPTEGDNEFLFDILFDMAKSISFYSKLEAAAQQFARENPSISSAGLYEALNSMYASYQDATLCYTYLSDVPTNVNTKYPDSESACSRWFLLGFTLQEPLAPKEVILLPSEWKVLEKKTGLYEILTKITGTGIEYLSHQVPLSSTSITKRMSWMAKRQASRLEDMAYCLLGIFSLDMPLRYGERDRAFIRLQE
ncbi:uncharacterized protein BDW43DRAFT_298188 [Aspergillus alliaceus]|uniref:uncharacterized protein n=1 Tax=Petromyces alliaceus TaxID=209559 RepID=UPI0012A4FDA0|nr:uncharacterized protein BDW43DRAFT_298188 [Aspergillus alliaceus]KAB8236613.1 hypothetical protein BDW43DRAFT_298188 [Aspergillus alliaceus]